MNSEIRDLRALELSDKFVVHVGIFLSQKVCLVLVIVCRCHHGVVGACSLERI